MGRCCSLSTPSAADSSCGRSARIVHAGSFDGICSTVESLSQQQQLFIPERWALAPRAGAKPGTLTGEIWATLFVVRQPEEAPRPLKPFGAGGKVAAQIVPG